MSGALIQLAASSTESFVDFGYDPVVIGIGVFFTIVCAWLWLYAKK